MNRKEFIATVAKKEGTTQAEIGRQLEVFLGAITDVLKTEGTIELFGFGKFVKEHKPAKSGELRGVPYQTSAKNVIKFKAAKALNDSLNN